jgi:hypothetical protein
MPLRNAAAGAQSHPAVSGFLPEVAVQTCADSGPIETGNGEIESRLLRFKP